jgi:hypothetical protein
MKNSEKLRILAIFAVFCAVIFSCVTTSGAAKTDDNEQGKPTLATGDWFVYNDENDKGNSTVNIVSAEETIDGNKVMVHTVTGNVTTKFQYGFAGWGLNADEKTLELYKTAKSVSFKILGDGLKYTIKFKTSNVKDYAYYEYSFNTQKGEALLIEVPIKFFMQPSWGQSVKKDQSLATGIEWQTHESWRKTPNNNPFSIKIWDFTVYN